MRISLLILFSLLPICHADTGWRSGLASWYTPKPQHVRMYGTQLLTASNEYRPGTRLHVTHEEKAVIVTVCGSGPFVRGRKLDLSRHAFSRLALPSRGVIRVQYRRAK